MIVLAFKNAGGRSLSLKTDFPPANDVDSSGPYGHSN